MHLFQTPLANDIDATNEKSKYDAQVKKVLANKIILAWILKYTMKEFKTVDISDIEKCIEGKVEVAAIPIEPGLTNLSAITGETNENAVPNEGKVTFDIRFFVILPDGEHTKVIINVEAQKDSEPGYDIVTRAIFYCARLLSAQLDQEFTNKTDDKRKYDNVKKVYSIWICMDSRMDTKDSIVEYHIVPNILHDGCKERTVKAHRYDLLSAVMIHLGGNHMVSENELVNMLTTLLSSEITKEEKKQKLYQEYHIPMTIEFEQEVDEMCNLSGYVERQGEIKGEIRGEIRGEIKGRENLIQLFTWLQEQGRSDEANEIMKLENEDLRSKLWMEYTEETK